MDIEIRKAVIKDAEQLYILNELFNGVNTTTLENLKDSLKYNKQEIVLIAIKNKAIVGFICGQVFKSMCYSTFYGEISELFVQENFRMQGVGACLIKGLEEEFKQNNIYSFQLFTGADNRTAQKFYEGQGYKKSEEWMYRKRI